MTTKITITVEEGSREAASVQLLDVAMGGAVDATDAPTRVEPGASHEVYIHGSRSVRVDEVQTDTAAPAPDHDPAREHIMQYFAYGHLPVQLAAVSKPFGDLAVAMVATLPRNPERTVALRKLLEAKDAAVRARLAKEVVR